MNSPFSSNLRVLTCPWYKKITIARATNILNIHFLRNVNLEIDYNIKSEASPLVERKFSQETYITRRLPA